MTTHISDTSGIPSIPWLDSVTDNLVRAITATLANRHPSVLAVILYGSVARHEERTLADPHPSDVDLLVLFDSDSPRLPFAEERAVFHSIGLARDRFLEAPREVQIMLASRHLREWDITFVAGVARDGIPLWAREPLPEVLAPVEARRRPFSSPASA
jgi:predicted nucleotidyltransferase